jgi:pre-mRNA-splicing factor CDC5/CEF1
MRILIKGGVWKNTEDEILKAAVMKYGKNGWSRVASLLNRKSARQCKARWYEWLDPSIKKTDWNKDEEEKLLHLAKLMPNQWRTIAPIVGRTAAQCMEHYERLLDQAQDEAAEPTDDPRRLRPGEIDPAPETKPARPDPIDMDEDEKEMLSEARARLANTAGKKAKRKARERQLGESKRLSMLQKRRELKAAGIESKLGGGNKKRKFIDYGTEIPFQKIPPAGFYEVNAENAEGKKVKLDPAVHGLELAKMEGRHLKEEEEKNRQKDQRALKKLYKENAPLAVAKVSADNDPTSLRRRVPLSLPTPQVSDGELEDIVKLGQNALMAPPTGLPSRGGTQALIADYSQQAVRALPTPSRTPMQEDIIMQEARNHRAMREMTPLFGDEQELPELYEGTGFAGVEPRKANLATPNTFLNLAGATPSRGGAGGASVMNTPGGASVARSAVSSVAGSVLRDPFGLNAMGAHDSYSESDMTSISSRTEKARGKFLLQQLQSLPEPEYVYEVALPEQPSEEDVQYEDGRPQGSSRVIEDAAEVRAKRLAQERQREEEELARRSSVLKRGLPRPSLIAVKELSAPTLSGKSYPASVTAASRVINEEMVRIMQHDALKFPTAGDFDLDSYQELEDIPDTYLSAARDLLQKDAPDFGSEKGQAFLAAFNATWERLHKDLVFIPVPNAPGAGKMGRPTTEAEWRKCLSLQYTALKAKFDKDAKRATKIEAKLQVTTLGYVNRSAQLQQGMVDAADVLSRSRMEAECFTALLAQEERALARRLAQLKKELAEAETQERMVQQSYAEIVSFSREIAAAK